MRLTKGAITNLIANYKSVLSKMFANNQASCKKQIAALLACLIMAAGSPVMAASPHTIGSGGDYETLQEFYEAVQAAPTLLTSGDTLKFLDTTDTFLEASFAITSDGEFKLYFDGTVKIEPTGDHQLITITSAGGAEIILAAVDSANITIDGFKNESGHGGAITGGTNDTVVISANDSTGTITGTITFSNNAANTAANSGGGAISSAHVVINGEDTKTLFMDNAAINGGAIRGGTSVTINNGTNIFDNNTVTGSGGAIISNGNVKIYDGDNTFINNTAGTIGNGGAIKSGTVEIIDGTNIFGGWDVDADEGVGNSAGVSGGAIHGTTSVTISGGNNYFDYNKAGKDGGAIASGTEVFLKGTSINTFTGNETTNGDGGAVHGTTVTLEDTSKNTFIGNKALFGGSGGSGGAIYGTTLTISTTDTERQNAFASNHADKSGGAIAGNEVTIADGFNIFGLAEDMGNTADQVGGAIFGTTSVTVTGGENYFNFNEAGVDGGAVAGAAVALKGGSINTFNGNEATNGDGGAVHGTTVTLDETSKNTFVGNKAFVNALDSGGSGGAIFGTTVTISGTAPTEPGNYNNLFLKNEAAKSGGAINSETVTITSGINIFGGTGTNDGNKANDGGGGAIAGKESVSISGGETLFQNNKATGSGGAIASGGGVDGDGDVTIDGVGTVVYFINNSTDADGGAIAADGNVTFKDHAEVLFYGNSSHGAETSALITEGTLSLENKATLVGEGGFMAANMDFDDSFIDLFGTISLNTAEDVGDPGVGTGTITFTDMTINGNGTLAGNTAITIDAAETDGLIVNTDGTITVSSQLDIEANSASLIKTGTGTLNLINTDNIYTTGTLDNQAGILNITVAEGTPGDPSNPGEINLGTVNNDARLNFVGLGGNFYAKDINIANEYTGDGTIGLQASLVTGDTWWSDYVTFDGGIAAGNTAKVGFTFAPGSSIKNIVGANLEFAFVDDGDAGSVVLDPASSKYGAYDLFVTHSVVDDTDGVYTLNGAVNPSRGKVYSEAAAAGLGQAVGMHGRMLFKATGEASRDAAANNTTGAFAGYGRDDSRFETGSHADVKGNNFIVAAGFRANEKTTWGVFGQMFKGDYDTDSGSGIYSNGDLDAHDFGLFVEYRPAGQTETGAGHYYKGIVRAGRTSSDFRSNIGGNAYSTFSMGRNVFGMSFGGGYLKAMDQDRTADIYTHLIYTGLDGNTTTDSLGQEINFGSSNSFRLLTGARLNFNQTKKTGAYVGAALDYEFSGKADAYIDGFKTDTADIKGLTGILELGLVTKPNATTAINLGLQGYVGKKQGLGGTLSFSKLF